MAKKVIAKVVLSKEQKEILTALSNKLGTSDSETMRIALMDYAKEVNLINEPLQRKKPQNKQPTKE
ncbi:MAG: ribbon-helix-helix protein, CopG family [Candidatus Bathyarchaeota archaeon]|nr:ribbon-helix-helix protein, CopG family [Candidatus Bathyarchaeota archaeon]